MSCLKTWFLNLSQLPFWCSASEVKIRPNDGEKTSMGWIVLRCDTFLKDADCMQWDATGT